MFLKLFPKVLFKASQMAIVSTWELALAPMLTLKVLVNIRLGQIVLFNSITNFYFLNCFQKCHQVASRWSGWPGWGWPWLPHCP